LNRTGHRYCQADIYKVDGAWPYLLYTWLPRSGYRPTQEPALEELRAYPREVGWSTFDIDRCVSVKPLAKR
jgi:DNA gyrase inhibitor GyrI